ncbi:MAG TPA: endonuclease/exonuclease/phosphatase family protein [Steroidobacteraceae bacterium]|nr:endonuclease/exonuclease/phosphatase family protein [Steroidobacteraceae bacterium]
MRCVLALSILAAVGSLPTAAAERPPGLIRIATFNCSLNRASLGALRRDLATPDNSQARAVAEIIQHVRPDILLLEEFDFDAAGESLREFQANYLGHAQNGEPAISFGHSFFTESNTGVPSGFDLDNDGRVEGGADALGFGDFPGQYAMALLSRFPIDAAHARTFRKFLWRDMPGALLPDKAETPLPFDWYSPAELAALPLSSKSHWDVPVKIGGDTLHLLASHPTPPAFDGTEDRNGLRNHDEIRFWSDYLTPSQAGYIRDDNGRRGGFAAKAFVIMGDQNSDPVDGGSRNDAINALLAHPRVDSRFVPQSAGAPEAGAVQGGANLSQKGDARFDTADFNDRTAGNLRVDYLLPSKGMRVCGGGVFWPAQSDPAAPLVWGDRPPPSSDHRLVWIDVTVDGARCPPGSDPTASEPSHPRH